MRHGQITAECHLDINNKNELKTHHGMNSRHMQKQHWENTLLSINNIMDDGLTCNVNKVYMYMILVMSIYAFLTTMGLFI